jgi:DNA-binding MarR family transcriptional regulator
MAARTGSKKQGEDGVPEALGRALGAATQQFHAAVAERLGVGVTDYRCLELLHRSSEDGPVTPGVLAEHTGLTSGAITAVLDRLEKAGLVRRDKDATDRRQVVVRLLPERAREIEALFEPLQRGWTALARSHDARELAAIRGFMARAAALLQQQAAELRGASEPEVASAGGPSVLSAPRGGVSRGRLEAARGLSRYTIAAGPAELLYRVRAEGPPPRVTARDGRVSIEPARSLARLFSRRVTAIELCPAIAWELVLRGGVADVEADLRGLEVASLEIGGGANGLVVRLPAPRGTVPVHIAGGANKIRLLRPAGAATRVLVGGGAHGLTIDTLQLGSVGGEMRWESPDFARSEDRHDIAVRGGANDVVIALDDAPARR